MSGRPVVAATSSALVHTAISNVDQEISRHAKSQTLSPVDGRHFINAKEMVFDTRRGQMPSEM